MLRLCGHMLLSSTGFLLVYDAKKTFFIHLHNARLLLVQLQRLHCLNATNEPVVSAISSRHVTAVYVFHIAEALRCVADLQLAGVGVALAWPFMFIGVLFINFCYFNAFVLAIKCSVWSFLKLCLALLKLIKI